MDVYCSNFLCDFTGTGVPCSYCSMSQKEKDQFHIERTFIDMLSLKRFVLSTMFLFLSVAVPLYIMLFSLDIGLKYLVYLGLMLVVTFVFFSSMLQIQKKLRKSVFINIDGISFVANTIIDILTIAFLGVSIYFNSQGDDNEMLNFQISSGFLAFVLVGKVFVFSLEYVLFCSEKCKGSDFKKRSQIANEIRKEYFDYKWNFIFSTNDPNIFLYQLASKQFPPKGFKFKRNIAFDPRKELEEKAEEALKDTNGNIDLVYDEDENSKTKPRKRSNIGNCHLFDYGSRILLAIVTGGLDIVVDYIQLIFSCFVCRKTKQTIYKNVYIQRMIFSELVFSYLFFFRQVISTMLKVFGGDEESNGEEGENEGDSHMIIVYVEIGLYLFINVVRLVLTFSMMRNFFVDKTFFISIIKTMIDLSSIGLSIYVTFFLSTGSQVDGSVVDIGILFIKVIYTWMTFFLNCCSNSKKQRIMMKAAQKLYKDYFVMNRNAAHTQISPFSFLNQIASKNIPEGFDLINPKTNFHFLEKDAEIALSYPDEPKDYSKDKLQLPKASGSISTGMMEIMLGCLNCGTYFPYFLIIPGCLRIFCCADFENENKESRIIPSKEIQQELQPIPSGTADDPYAQTHVIQSADQVQQYHYDPQTSQTHLIQHQTQQQSQVPSIQQPLKQSFDFERNDGSREMMIGLIVCIFINPCCGMFCLLSGCLKSMNRN